MDFKKLEYFYIVAKEGSVSKAAEKLNYAQSNLSTMIRRLEEEVDAQLFYRSPQGMTLTQKGEELYQYASQMLNISGKISQAMKERSGSSSLRIGTVESIAVTILPEILSDYNSIWPADSVQVEVGEPLGPGGLMERVLDYELDLAFVAGEVDSPELESRFIGEDHLILVSNTDYGENVSVSDLLADRVLTFPTGCCCRVQYDKFAKHVAVQPRHIVETDSLSAMFANVMAGMGIAGFPRSCIPFYCSRFPVYIYPIPDPYGIMPWSVTYRKDAYISRAMKGMIKSAMKGKPYHDGVGKMSPQNKS